LSLSRRASIPYAFAYDGLSGNSRQHVPGPLRIAGNPLDRDRLCVNAGSRRHPAPRAAR
jgi:hypothetical protein